MQNSRGWPIKARASCNFCLARTCGGMTGIGGIWARRFCQYRHAQKSKAAAASAARAYKTHAQPLAISTGGLISRSSFVAVLSVPADLEIRLVAAIRGKT